MYVCRWACDCTFGDLCAAVGFMQILVWAVEFLCLSVHEPVHVYMCLRHADKDTFSLSVCVCVCVSK